MIVLCSLAVFECNLTYLEDLIKRKLRKYNIHIKSSVHGWSVTVTKLYLYINKPQNLPNFNRVRQKEAEEEERSREYLDNRMQAVLTLKRNIETNKENLTALQARDAKLAREKQEQEEQERAEILAQGIVSPNW